MIECPYGVMQKGNDDKIRGGIWYNAWLMKFIPGLVLGYVGKLFFDKNEVAKVGAHMKG